MTSYQINTLHKLIEEIDSMIDRITVLTREDLAHVIYYLRSIDHTTLLKSESMRGVIEQMQCFDLLCQRTSHLKSVHLWLYQALKEFNVCSDEISSKTNLLRLNQLQFQVACFDYLNSAEQIKSAFINTDSLHTLSVFDKANFFKHTSVLVSSLRTIDIAFEEAIKIANAWKGIGVTEYILKLQHLYSMQSERNVLQAYLDNPCLEETDVKNITRNSESETSSIDLF